MQLPHRPAAVVTGASSGIGRALVQVLSGRGYGCVAADIDGAGLARLCADPALASNDIAPFETDVSSEADVERLAEFAFARLGRVDLLVNNAGVLGTGVSWKTPAEEWRRILDINLFSVIHAMRSFVPRLMEQGTGHIVNIASMAALTSGAQVGPYSTSKHGVLAISECVARELAQARSAVCVSVVFPGAVQTNLAKPLLSRSGQPPSRIDQALNDLTNQGMPAEQLAEFVLDAVADGAFGVFPHPAVRDAARARLEQILAGKLEL
jgi:NAD(P)-dependent dehydrogenase (short-subunit alcohol dehydrogenase family)